MFDRHSEILTDKHVRLVMQTYGKFHALSFALKDQRPEQFKSFISNIDSFGRRNAEQTDEFINFLSNGVIDSVAHDPELVEMLKNVYKNIREIDSGEIFGNGAVPNAVLCHGQ